MARTSGQVRIRIVIFSVEHDELNDAAYGTETREKRLNEAINLLTDNKKMGLN